MKRTFIKRPVVASGEVSSYGGYAIGLEESGDQNYYVRIGNKILYAQTEEELRAAIDKYAKSGNSREVLDQLCKQYVKNATDIYAGTSSLTLSDILSLISALDLISIHDTDGEVVFDGKCGDFRATTNRRDLLDAPVGRIRGYRDTIIILL